MESLKRRENESKFEYTKRIVYGKLIDKTIDLDFSELSILIFNKKLSSDDCRRRCYGLKYLFQLMDKENISKISDNEILKKIEEKTLELEKEKIKFQDQKREYRNYLRADARFEHLQETLIKEIQKINQMKPFKLDEIVERNSNKEMVVMCSDWHIGLEEDNYWNTVNIEIMRKRIEKYTKKIIEIILKDNIQVLHLELLGDLINGLIHVTTRISNEEDIIKQTMICSEFLANMIYKIAKVVPQIKIYSTTGNHGRCVANYKESLEVENFEKLIPWYLQERLKELVNVKFVDNLIKDDEIIVYKFLNETIFLVHGHNDKIKDVINDLSQMLRIFPTEIHLGHYHQYYEKDNNDISVVVNSTASGVDKFSKKIRKISKPMQVCMVYTPEGRECTYKIRL